MQGANAVSIRLYCFAYVGGSALVYKPWQRLLPANITVCPIELPGHTMRMKESPIDDYEVLVEKLTQEIAADFEKQRTEHSHYATYGHCTGSPLSFYIAASLAKRLGQAPLRCFVAASYPPDMPVAKLTELKDEELFCLLDRMGGTPTGLMKDRKLREMFLPVLRADAKINDACYVDRGVRVNFPFTLFAAKEDQDLKAENIWQWSRYTTAACRNVTLAGGHFHGLNAPQELLSHVRVDLAAVTALHMPVSTMQPEINRG